MFLRQLILIVSVAIVSGTASADQPVELYSSGLAVHIFYFSDGKTLVIGREDLIFQDPSFQFTICNNSAGLLYECKDIGQKSSYSLSELRAASLYHQDRRDSLMNSGGNAIACVGFLTLGALSQPASKVLQFVIDKLSPPDLETSLRNLEALDKPDAGVAIYRVSKDIGSSSVVRTLSVFLKGVGRN